MKEDRYIFTVRSANDFTGNLHLDTWLKVEMSEGMDPETLETVQRIRQKAGKEPLGKDLINQLTFIQLRLRFNTDMYPHICMVKVPAGTELTPEGFEAMLRQHQKDGRLSEFLSKARIFKKA